MRNVEGAGRRGRRPLHGLWNAVNCADNAGFDGRPRRANSVRPYRFVAVGVVFQSFYIQFSSFKQGAGSAFLCDQNLSSCSPNSRWQNVSSYTATLQDIQFGIIPLYLSRKAPLLLHKKCNNCRNVAKLKYKSFVCTNWPHEFCIISTVGANSVRPFFGCFSILIIICTWSGMIQDISTKTSG